MPGLVKSTDRDKTKAVLRVTTYTAQGRVNLASFISQEEARLQDCMFFQSAHQDIFPTVVVIHSYACISNFL